MNNVFRHEWYTPAEVAVHNKPHDCWVSLNGKVLDLTKWLQQQIHACQCMKKCRCTVKNWFCQPDCMELCQCFQRGYLYCDGKRLASTIIANAGKDISYWFHGDDWVMYTHPVMGARVPYMPHGAHSLQPVVPSTRWRPYLKPWWLDPTYVIGKLSAKTRPIRIMNTLTGSTVTLEVCSEETLYQIMNRYFPHNCHFNSYTWRYMRRGLCLFKTLQQNGIPDERERFSDVALPENLHIPCILIYYNDDLTEDPTLNMMCLCKDNDCKAGYGQLESYL